MRVAYLSTDPGIVFGGTKGASVHVEEMVRAIASQGAEVCLLVARVAPVHTEPSARVTVEALPGLRRDAPAARRIGSEAGLVEWLVRRLRRFRADVLYERLALHSAAGSEAAHRLGIPHVVEMNAPLLEESARYRRLDLPEVADRLERRILRDADLVLPVSPPLAEYARGRGARRVEVLQNAVDIERFSPRPRPRSARPVAVFVGSLRPWHGADTIAAAWRALGSAAPPLLIVGDGPARGSLEPTGARFVGSVPHSQVPSILAGSDIGLAPYSADAPRYFSPLKMFEYLAAGLATIVADLPSVTEVVDPASAVLVPSGDARALAEAVARLASDPEERRRLGERGRATVAEAHTWPHRARRVLEAISGLERYEASAG